MKTTFKTAIPILLLTILASCGSDKSGQISAQARPALPFPVMNVPTKTVTTYASYPTNIEGIVNSEVRAKISGYITEVLVDEGEKVRKGQALFKLETQSMNQDAEAAKANVNAAQVEVNKLQPLVAKNIISEVQLETAKAKLQQAKSGYNSIAANIGYGTIVSPVDGYIGAIRMRTGALVSPTNQTPLSTVSNISKVYAYFSMNEKEYLNFLLNASGNTKQEKIANLPEVTLILANGKEYDQKGTIETINSQINPNTGTITFRALFDNTAGLLNNGNSGTIKVPSVFENVLVVPQEATFEQQEMTFVYVLSEDNTVTSKAIRIKGNADSMYILESGLQEGETIVAKGVGKLRNGSSITPQKVEFEQVAQLRQTEFQ
ncbi:Efflux pump periplasmic linker BepF [Arenibacter antarcticus]|uniref:Efflux RND transporter periplasmic adaptor subunit n=1 Tax=Arenibacter antarcticus TaxID=2040469 RepID=A0ABW5VGF2_9FLAO|nr:efflux RND transporter periplasmic adaptor subunit [Arenibacter sp. H213]MCM4166529.1 efflux RND transporter periplasmic adaptor subunit [Arenibacter sp. H213]